MLPRRQSDQQIHQEIITVILQGFEMFRTERKL